MFCSKCGAQNSENSGYCTQCGTPLNSPLRQPSSGTSTNLEPNIAALLSYVLGWVNGIVFFLIEKDNDYVRFHALQSIVVFGAFTIAQIILSIFTIVPYVWIFANIISGLMGLGAFVLWIVLMIKSFQGERFHVPYAGDFAEKHI